MNDDIRKWENKFQVVSNYKVVSYQDAATYVYMETQNVDTTASLKPDCRAPA